MEEEELEDNKTIVELRKKLEIRSWFLRSSLALNISVITGLVIHFFDHYPVR